MKTITPTLESSSHRVPDFCDRLTDIKLDQITGIKGHGKLTVRPIRLDDEEEMIHFHENISEESIYMRYFEYLGLDRRTSHDRLVRICMNGAESYAIVVERPASKPREAAILAVGRLTKTSKPFEASFDTLMIDQETIPKLGKALVTQLIKLARAFGFQVLTGEFLVADHDTLNLCRKLGFSLHTLPEDGLVRVTIDL